MHDLRPIAIDDLVAWCVCLCATRLRSAKTAEQIEVLFWMDTLWGPRNKTCIRWSPDAVRGRRG